MTRRAQSVRTRIHTGKVPVLLPKLRPTTFRSYISRDPDLNLLGWELAQPGETWIATIGCLYERRRYHFVVWFPARVKRISSAILFGIPILTSLAAMSGTTVVMGSLTWGILAGLIAAYAALRLARWLGPRHLHVWRNCTGFLALDAARKPLVEESRYPTLFQAYAIMEEAYLRLPGRVRLGDKGIARWVELLKGSAEMESGPHAGCSTTPQKSSSRDLIDSVACAMTASLRLQNLLVEIGEEGHIRRAELLEEIDTSKRLVREVAARAEATGPTSRLHAAFGPRRLAETARRKLERLEDFEGRIAPSWNSRTLRIPDDVAIKHMKTLPFSKGVRGVSSIKKREIDSAQDEQVKIPEIDRRTVMIAAIGAKMSWNGMARRAGAWIVLVALILLSRLGAIVPDLELTLLVFATVMIFLEMMTAIETSRLVQSLPTEAVDDDQEE